MFGSSAFGQPSTGGFGASSSGFGQQTTGGFGSTFGSTSGGGFGSSTTGGFGSPTTGGFGAPSTGGFGAPQSAGAFGAPTAGAFGSPSTFGAASTGFGSPSAVGGGFGSASTSRFGSSPTVGGFGQPQQQQNSSFGGGSGGFGSTGGRAQPKHYNPANDMTLDLSAMPSDTISSLDFVPNQQLPPLLAVGAWDKTVRVYEVNDQSRQLVPKAMASTGGPVLDVSFKNDGSAVFTGGCDNAVNKWDVRSGAAAAQQVGAHAAPVKCVAWVEEINCLVSASWDRTLKYWDLRSPNAVQTINLPERAYAMDVKHPILVVCCGSSNGQSRQTDQMVLAYNLQNPQTPFRTQSYQENNVVLKHHYRDVSVFADRSGYVCCSAEGRASIQVFDKSQPRKTFAFKCHRDKQRHKIYACNVALAHPSFPTILTAGSNGVYTVWDPQAKAKVKEAKIPCKFSDNVLAPITSCAYSARGDLLAYSVGYQWDQGAANKPQSAVDVFMVRKLDRAEVAPKN